MTNQRNYDPNNKDEVFPVLRREILAARFMVTLDEQLDNATSRLRKSWHRWIYLSPCQATAKVINNL